MMKKQIVLRDPEAASFRRQPLLNRSDFSTRSDTSFRMRVAEVAGGTAAECTVVACCCPCALVDILVLVVYKVPAGLCRRAIRRKRHQRLLNNGLLPTRKCGICDMDKELFQVSNPLAMVNGELDNKEVIQLEKEMWDKFYGTGFWRSSSQRSEISSVY